MALVNVWHLRKVAEASSKACDICYKPTTSVLITPDNKDYFYICQGHLKDRGFASPIIDGEAAAKKKKDEMEREIELVKKEYEEKIKKKKKKPKSDGENTKGNENEKQQEKEKDDDADDVKASKEKDDKITAIVSNHTPERTEEEPRIFALHKVFFQKRLDRVRNAEIAKRNRERLKSPNFFPSVPTNLG